MRFENKVHTLVGSKLVPNYNVLNAIDEVNRLLEPSSKMILYAADKQDWKYDIRSGVELAFALVQMPKRPIPIEMYYPKYKGSAQTAAWDGTRIGLSAYYLQRATEKDLIASIVHEWCHAVGLHHQDKGWYGRIRANYWSLNKSKYSAPYHLSDNIGLWI